MTRKLTYEELEKKVQELEQEKFQFLQTEEVNQKRITELTLSLRDDESPTSPRAVQQKQFMTDCKKADDDLRESEKQYRTTLENLVVGVVVHGEDRSILYTNPEAKKALGLTYAQMSGKETIDPAWNILDENLSIMEVEDYPVRKVLSTKQPIFDSVFGVKRPDKKDITWVIVNAKPVFSASGDVARIIVSFTDYTERKQGEELLKRNEGLLNITQHFAKIGGWEIDLESQTLFWTDEVFHIHDLATDTFKSNTKNELKRKCDDVPGIFSTIDEATQLSLGCYEEQDRPLVIEAFRKCAEEGQPYDFEFPFTTTKGRRLWIRTIANPVMKGDSICKVVGSFIDITERKQAEEEKKKLESQLHQAVKLEALGTLAGGIAHDFNNILASILGHSQMALDELPPKSPIYEDLQQIMISGERAADLVNRILLFSRQEAEHFHPMQLQETIKEVVRMFRPSLPSSIKFTESIDGKCGSIYADPIQIHQVIMNLGTNARQAIKDDYGSISIDLLEISPPASFFEMHGLEQTAQTYACIEIHDSGCGIPAEIQTKIFDPFFTTKMQDKGTGLGLAVVDSIVRKHQGVITFESDSKKGTVFHIYLPVVESNQATAVVVANRVAKGSERILLVDDEQMLNELHKRSLEKFGYQVTCFSDSLKALNYFQQNSNVFDIIVTDMTMPNMTGLDLIKEIWRIKPDIKTIICTGYSKSVTETTAIACGVNGYLPKPFLPRLLAETIRKVCDHA